MPLAAFLAVNARWAFAFAVGAVMSNGCIVHTPPARGVPLETAAPVGDARSGLQLEGAKQAGGASATSGALRLRHGIDDDTDVSVEATAIRIPPYTTSPPPDDRLDTWALRAGAKHRLSRSLALIGGAGAGLFPGGPFVAPDGGLVTSWNNGYVEPFASLRISVSLPLESKKVVEDGRQQVPRRAWYYGPTAGLRVPIGWTGPRRGELRGALLAGATYTWMSEDLLAAPAAFIAYALGGEMTF